VKGDKFPYVFQVIQPKGIPLKDSHQSPLKMAFGLGKKGEPAIQGNAALEFRVPE